MIRRILLTAALVESWLWEGEKIGAGGVKCVTGLPKTCELYGATLTAEGDLVLLVADGPTHGGDEVVDFTPVYERLER